MLEHFSLWREKKHNKLTLCVSIDFQEYHYNTSQEINDTYVQFCIHNDFVFPNKDTSFYETTTSKVT